VVTRIADLASIGAAGFWVQNISFTVTVPLYLLLHILTSPVAKSSPKINSVAVSSLDLRLLPISVTLGKACSIARLLFSP
jgi:hypothetical protein